MYRLFLLSMIAISGLSAFAFGLDSSVPGITIKNVHLVTEEQGRLYRGAEPKKKIAELLSLGITDVLIVKKDTKGEVEKEIAAWKDAGFTKRQITHIDILWDKVENEQENCEKFVAALKVIRKALRRDGAQLYMHCTVGEDRTGVLAGLTRMLQDGWSAEKVFAKEMCAHGFGDGRGKPQHVAQKVYQSLSPTFQILANAVADGRLTWDNLDASVCADNIEPEAAIAKWNCQTIQ